MIWRREVCDECCTAMLEVILPCMCEQQCMELLAAQGHPASNAQLHLLHL